MRASLRGEAVELALGLAAPLFLPGAERLGPRGGEIGLARGAPAALAEIGAEHEFLGGAHRQ